MANPDPYLRPGLTPPTDVELYASEAAGGTTTPVTAEVTATGQALVSHVFIPGGQPAPVGGGGRWRPTEWTAPRQPLAYTLSVLATCHARPAVRLEVDNAGRRHQEDELVLVGAP